MKNTISKLTGLALLSVLAFTTSCSDDDDKGGTNNNSSVVLEQDNLKGELNEGTVVLESGKTYLLTGRLLVNDGATLRIEPGAAIEATDVTSSTPEIRYMPEAQAGKLTVHRP